MNINNQMFIGLSLSLSCALALSLSVYICLSVEFLVHGRKSVDRVKCTCKQQIDSSRRKIWWIVRNQMWSQLSFESSFWWVLYYRSIILMVNLLAFHTNFEYIRLSTKLCLNLSSLVNVWVCFVYVDDSRMTMCGHNSVWDLIAFDPKTKKGKRNYVNKIQNYNGIPGIECFGMLIPHVRVCARFFSLFLSLCLSLSFIFFVSLVCFVFFFIVRWFYGESIFIQSSKAEVVGSVNYVVNALEISIFRGTFINVNVYSLFANTRNFH